MYNNLIRANFFEDGARVRILQYIYTVSGKGVKIPEYRVGCFLTQCYPLHFPQHNNILFLSHLRIKARIAAILKEWISISTNLLLKLTYLLMDGGGMWIFWGMLTRWCCCATTHTFLYGEAIFMRQWWQQHTNTHIQTHHLNCNGAEGWFQVY